MSYGRWASLVAAVAVCVLTFGGVLGIGPGQTAHSTAAESDVASVAGQSGAAAESTQATGPNGSTPSTEPAQPMTTLPSMTLSPRDQSGQDPTDTQHPAKPETTQQATKQLMSASFATLPPNSGSGKRVVYDESAQRVWLVTDDNSVKRTYQVSGSLYDNLDPGTYQVYSRSKHAIGYKYEETMDYMVRFAHGENAAIGFHDIPTDKDGNPVQGLSELGTPQSDGCIRQWIDDAKALWGFAPVGTTVVVLA